jgi:hypothetical protein
LNNCVSSLHLLKITFKSQTRRDRKRSRNRGQLTIDEFIHHKQHFFVERVGTVARMGTPEKAFHAISRNHDPDSNITEESDQQSAKHH